MRHPVLLRPLDSCTTTCAKIRESGASVQLSPYPRSAHSVTRTAGDSRDADGAKGHDNTTTAKQCRQKQQRAARHSSPTYAAACGRAAECPPRPPSLLPSLLLSPNCCPSDTCARGNKSVLLISQGAGRVHTQQRLGLLKKPHHALLAAWCPGKKMYAVGTAVPS